MTGITKRIPIGQALAGVVNTDEAIADINLRLSSGGGAVYNGTHIGDGVYEFTGIESGAYKVFSGGTELSKVDWVVIGETGTILATQISGVINVASIPSSIPATRIADGSVTNAEFQTLDTTSSIQTQLNARAVLSAINTFTNSNIFRDIIVGSTYKIANLTYAVPVDNREYVMKKYVDDQIIAYLTGLVIPMAQQSDRTIRVIYGGTFEGGANPRVDTNIDDAIANAVALTPAVGKQYYIYIEKNGLETSYGSDAIMSSGNDYVHIQGQNIGTLISPADSTFTSGALGRRVIRDCTLDWSAGMTATPNFVNYIFENVTFSVNDNALNLNTCILLNCRMTKSGGGTWTINNCNGTPVLADVIPTITGYSPKIQIAGQYNQRQLGLRGTTVASATDITLGTVGNYFRISGTTTIERMSLTGWTEGSPVILYFEGALTLTNGAAGAGHFALAGGTNFTTSAGDTIQVVYDNNIWYEVSRSVN